MKTSFIICILISLIAAAAPSFAAAPEDDTAIAATAVNALGLELLSRVPEVGDDALLSPYSVQVALAMTYAGADGTTRREMARVLHYPEDDSALHGSFEALRDALDEIARVSEERAAESREPTDPIVFVLANRLFGQQGYRFRQPFLDLLRKRYDAPLETVDFKNDPEGARGKINGWVESRTQDKINELIPFGAVNEYTRLVLANAIYLKAPWALPFDEAETKPRAFHLPEGSTVDVPTMRQTAVFGYARRDGVQVVTIPYAGDGIQLLVMLPDSADSLSAFEARVTPALLKEWAGVPSTRLILDVPKFSLAPPVMPLKPALLDLGMKTAFDVPPRTADFDRMAPQTPDDYLYISSIFHKTFMDLDEKGTEAAAATAVVMTTTTSARPPVTPIEVKIDRPFLFAIQHRASGACLFLGRVTDPR